MSKRYYTYEDACSKRLKRARTLFRVVGVSENREQVTVVIPSWDPVGRKPNEEWRVRLPMINFRIRLRKGIEVGNQYFGRLHLTAYVESELHATVSEKASGFVDETDWLPRYERGVA